MMARIRELMDSRDLNQAALANIAGVSKGSVSHWFAGKVSPKAEPLSRIADYFGVSVEYIMTGEDGPRRVTPLPSRAVPVRVLGAAHAGDPDEPWELDGEAMAPDSVVAGNMGHSDGTTKGTHYQKVTMRAKCMAPDLLADLIAEADAERCGTPGN